MATIRYSTNATTWTTVTPSGTNTNTTSGFTLANYASASVNGIANIGSIIGVTTNLGHVLRSNTSFDQFHYTNAIESGTTWTTRTLPRAMGQRSIIFGQEVFLNDDITQNAILRSTNGVSWTTISSLPTTRIRMAYGNGLWLSVSTGTGSNSKAYSSTNAISWTTTTIPKTGTWDGSSRAVTAIAFGNGVFAAIGTSNGGTECTIKSTDGISWQVNAAATNSPTLYNNLYYGNGAWLAYAGAYNTAVVRSTDLVVWTSITTTLGTNWPRGFAYGNGIWVVGTFQSGDRFRRSTNGITWTTANSGLIKNDGTSTLVADTFYGDGKFIAVGWYGTRARSTDGISWVSNNQGLGGSTADTSIRFGNGIWVHSGDYGTAGPGGGGTIGLYTSEASQTFSSISQLQKLTDNNFGMISSGQLLTSTDMVTFTTQNLAWVTLPTLNNPINDVAFANNTWVAGGNSSISSSTNGITWTTRQTVLDFLATTVRSVVYGNGVWIAGGGGLGIPNSFACLFTSTDSVTWTTRTTDATSSRLISKVDFINNTYIGILNNFYSNVDPQIMTSTNSISWATRATFNFAKVNLNSLAYGNGIYTAVGNSGAMSTSTDLLSWTTRTSTFGSSNITVVAYGNGIWFAAGAGNQIRTSTDAITWTTRTNNDIAAAAYLDNVWIGTTGNSVQISTDAISWVTSITIPSVGSIIRVGSNNTKRIYSSNSTTLNRMTPFNLGYTPTINKVDFSENKNIYLFDDGYMYVSSSAGFTDALNTQTSDRLLDGAVKSGIYNVVGENAIYRSTNGISWTTISVPSNARTFDTANTGLTWTTRNAFFGVSTSSDFTIQVNSVAYGGPVVGRTQGWIAVGDTGKLRRSTNGITWTTQNSTFGTTTINAIAYGNIWIAAGSTGQMRLSTDSVNWTTQNSTFGTSNINGLAYNNGLWLAVGSAAIRTSTNGLTWVTVNSTDTNTYSEIAYGAGKWVIAGSSGTVRVSTDTVTWVTGTVANNASWRGVAYGGGMWVLGGGTSGIPGNTVTQQSTDGITWTSLSMGWDNTGFAYDPGPYAIAYANGVWFAGGAPNYDMYKSTNGVNWLRVATFTPSSSRSPLRDIAYGGGMWVAVGSYGFNPQSFTITSPQLFSNNYPITDIISI